MLNKLNKTIEAVFIISIMVGALMLTLNFAQHSVKANHAINKHLTGVLK